jgi:hypothetical protein
MDAEKAKFFRDVARSLAALAEEENLDMLAYLLRMVEEEAKDLMTPTRHPS